MLILKEKGMFFYKFYKRLQNKRAGILINNFGKGYFLTGHSEKGYQFQNVEHTVKGLFCGPLFTHRYTVDKQAPCPPPGGKTQLSRGVNFKNFMTGMCGPNLEDPLLPIHIQAKPENHAYLYNLT